MKKQIYKYNENGFFVETVLINDTEEIPVNHTDIQIQEGLFKPKFTGFEWVEGFSQQEIDEIKNQSVEFTSEQEQGQRILAIELGRPTSVTANSLYNDYVRGWATDDQVNLAVTNGIITQSQADAIKNGTFVVL